MKYIIEEVKLIVPASNNSILIKIKTGQIIHKFCFCISPWSFNVWQDQNVCISWKNNCQCSSPENLGDIFESKQQPINKRLVGEIFSLTLKLFLKIIWHDMYNTSEKNI